MQKILFLFVSICFYQVVYGQSKEETALNQAVETLKNALLAGDQSALDAITVAELSYGHSSGLIEDKAAFLDVFASGNTDYVRIDLTEQTVKVAGNTASVRHKMAVEIIDKGKTISLNLAVLLIWIRQKGQWKLFARQATKI